MNRSARETSPETVLLVGGAIGVLSVGGQFFTLYSDSDLSTPIGRFKAMAVAIEHFAPLLGATILLLAGSWSSDRRVLRGLVAGCLVLIVLLCLAGIPFMLPDARRLASGVVGAEVTRFRGQVTREFLYLISMASVLSFALWKFVRRTPLTA